jgi:hypothetical protein
MSKGPQTKIPVDRTKGNYPPTWHTTQEEMDAYDDLMRKVNYQRTEYS